MSLPLAPVIVGAGPAGLRAAQVLVDAGLRPTLLDEGQKPGGQIYRQPPDGFTRDGKSLYGFEHRKADALHRLGADLSRRVDYIPGATVWEAFDQQLLYTADGRSHSLAFTHLILATGAMDRVLPFPGWLLPGVYTLGAAQIALKTQGCSVGQKVVMAGTGPLLYLVAYQYAKAGIDVAAVLDSSTFGQQAKAVPGMLTESFTLLKGLYYVGWLRAKGISVHTGVDQLEAHGSDRVESLSWESQGKRHFLQCDAVAFGYMLRSESQLASVLGCAFEFSNEDQAWVPQTDRVGRASLPGIYLAGDGARIGGADVAELAGHLAAWALLEDARYPIDHEKQASLLRRLERAQRFRTALNRAFTLPSRWAQTAPDSLVVCRCEEITAGEIRAAVRDAGAAEINRAKALVRVGMGRCQGRVCAEAGAQLVAHELGVSVREVGRLRPQAPIKPIPMSMLCRATKGQGS